MHKQRRTYFDSLRALIEMVQPDQKVDWIQARDHLFCVLHGLPFRVVISLGLHAVRRYLPVLKVRHPEVERSPEMLLHWIERSLDDAGAQEQGVEQEPLGSSNLGAKEYDFLQSVECLRSAATSADRSPGLLAARVEWCVWCCILQRRENVWVADDPVAAAASEEWQTLDELTLMAQEPKERSRHQAKLIAMEEFLTGRGLDDNVAANAVAWREWSAVLDWLQDAVERYPEVDVETLEFDFKRWEKSGGSWEAMMVVNDE